MKKFDLQLFAEESAGEATGAVMSTADAAGMPVADGEAADDGGGHLRAGIAGGSHQHGNEGYQRRHGGQRVLEPAEHHAAERR